MAQSNIHRRKKVLERDEFGLQLDHKQRTAWRMKRQDVDDSAFTVDRERDLGGVYPSRQFREVAGESLVHGRVPRVHQAFQFSVTKAKSDLDAHVERRCDTSQCLCRDVLQMTAFDRGDDPGRNSGALGDVDLAQAAADADGAESGADTLIVHGARVSARALISRLSAARSSGNQERRPRAARYRCAARSRDATVVSRARGEPSPSQRTSRARLDRRGTAGTEDP